MYIGSRLQPVKGRKEVIARYKRVFVVSELFNVATSDIGAKKTARCK